MRIFENLVPVGVEHRQDVSVVWRDQGFLPDASDADLARTFGVRTIPSPAEGDSPCASRQYVAHAEIYGGYGIGRNGGGARSVLIAEYLVKGAGPNVLLAHDAPPHHAHGSLSLDDAVCEVVNSLVHQRVLPFGVVPCRAIIGTGAGSGHVERPDGEISIVPGALLVRDHVVRPASCMRSGFITGDAKVSAGNDRARTKRVCHELCVTLGGPAGLARALGQFYAKTAHQLSRTRMLALVHGAMSPSNIALDGRFLDLRTMTSCTYRERSRHAGTRNRLGMEKDQTLTFARELIHGINISCGLDLDCHIFENLFRENYRQGSMAAAAWLFGHCPAIDHDVMAREIGRYVDDMAIRYVRPRDTPASLFERMCDAVADGGAAASGAPETVDGMKPATAGFRRALLPCGPQDARLRISGLIRCLKILWTLACYSRQRIERYAGHFASFDDGKTLSNLIMSIESDVRWRIPGNAVGMQTETILSGSRGRIYHDHASGDVVVDVADALPCALDWRHVDAAIRDIGARHVMRGSYGDTSYMRAVKAILAR